MPERAPSQSPGSSELVFLGLTVAATLVLAIGIGWVLDALLGTSPALLFAGLAVGIALSGAYLVSKFRAYLK